MRFKIRTIMLAIAATALVLVSLRDERIFAVLFFGGLLTSCVALGRGLWLAAKPFRRVSAVGFGAAVIIINAAPEWAGVFRIVGSAFDSATGRVGLITDNNPGGRAGFERHGPGSAGGGPFYNLAYDKELSERWRYVEED